VVTCCNPDATAGKQEGNPTWTNYGGKIVDSGKSPRECREGPTRVRDIIVPKDDGSIGRLLARSRDGRYRRLVNMRILNTCAAALVGLALTATVVGAQADDKATIAAGKKLFNTTDPPCTKCHGAEGKGKKDKETLLDGVGTRLSPAQIREWIVDPETQTAKLEKQPKVAMKPVKLTDPEVDALVAYLLSLKPR
jgi:mono/diheme cytochrome c family protein